MSERSESSGIDQEKSTARTETPVPAIPTGPEGSIALIAEWRGGQIPLVSTRANDAVRKILNGAELLKDHAYDIGYCDAKGDAGNKATGRTLQAGEDLGRIRAGIRELIVALRRGDD